MKKDNMSILMTKEKLKKSEEIVIMPQVPEVQAEAKPVEDNQDKLLLKLKKKKPPLNDNHESIVFLIV